MGIFVGSLTVQAEINQALNFTGKVTETDGSELADGVYDFNFSLYTQATGGTSLWNESLTATSSFTATISGFVVGANTIVYTYGGASATSTLQVGQYLSNVSGDSALIADFDTSANTVTVVGTSVWANGVAINNRPFVEGGVIDVDLGAVSSLTGINFDQPLYLEVIFNGEVMRPRQIIYAVAQAFNADTLDGFHSTDFANLTDNSTVTGEWTFNNIVNIATSSSQTALTVSQSGSGSLVDFRLGTTTALAVLNDGRVQIGNYYFPTTHGAPGYVLKTNVAGNLYWDVDFAGSGGGSGLWASSTDNSLVFQADTGQIVILGNNATSSPISAQFEVQGLSWFDDVAISNQQFLRFYDSDSSNYMALRATGTMSADYILTLPADTGSAGEALLSDGNGNLSWGNPSSSGTVNSATLAGQIPFYASASNAVTATSTIFLDPNLAYVGIGTTAPVNLLSVNGTADFDRLCFGSSCITSWSGAGAIDGSGTAGYVTFWQDADTLDSEQYLSAVRGGLAQDFSGSTGFVFFNAGIASASSTIAISKTDLVANSGINLNGNLLTLNNTGNWTGTLDGLEGADLFTLADWLATTSAPQLTTLVNLTSVGSITSGAWQASAIGVGYGGTAKSSWTAHSIPYLSDSSTFGEIAIGSSTYLLAVNATGDGYEWVEASSTGTVLSQEQVDDYVDALINDLDSTHTRINITYDDADNAMDFVVDGDLSHYDNSASQFFSTTTDTLAVDYGGTGRSTWTQYSIPYMASSNSYGEIAIGTSTYILSVNASGDGYEWVEASSTGTVLSQEQVDDYVDALINDPDSVHSRITITYDDTDDAMDFVVDDNLANYNNSNSQFFSTTTDILAANYGGTGQNSSIWTGFSYVSGGVWSASSTIASTNLDSAVMLAGEGNALLANTAGYVTASNNSWTQSSDQLMIHPNPDTQVVLVGASATSSSGYIFEVAGNALFGGSISAQDLSLVNAMNVASGGTGSSTPSGLLYGDGAGNIVSVNNNSANWNTAYSWGNHADSNYFSTTTDTLDIAYGGTGRTAWTANSLVYADAINSLGQIAPGTEGEALVMQGGVPTWSTTTPGTAHRLLSTLHTGTEATSTQERGDMLIVNSANNYTRLALGASGYILRSNGLDATWVPTINITELGTITTGTWQGDVIGLAFGGTGSTTAMGARQNLGLSDIYDNAINTTATSGWLWMSDGVGRGEWVASTTILAAANGEKSRFVGTTTLTTNGSFSTSTLTGYEAANAICASEYSDSHYCRTYDILVTIEQDNIDSWNGDDAWIAEGPPGYTSNSNDCQGWTTSVNTALGAFWIFDRDGGGAGWLVNCANTKPLACCRWQ